LRKAENTPKGEQSFGNIRSDLIAHADFPSASTRNCITDVMIPIDDKAQTVQ
jgi:hypothetical protein